MSQSVVLKSFAELAETLNLDELPDEPLPSFDDQTTTPAVPVDDQPASATIPVGTSTDLAALLGDLEAAATTLTTISHQDQEARIRALRDLERYDALIARQHEAEQARERARQMRQQAEQLLEAAFADEARSEAQRIFAVTSQIESATDRIVAEQRAEAERLATQLDLDRLLAERRRQKEAERAKAAEAERARRLSDALTGAKAALAAGCPEEAKGLLESVTNENPNNPEITSLRPIIAQRELTVNVIAAEDALREARREYRRDPAVAVARLETLDVSGLPDSLARQVFGEWARACSRLCRERGAIEPLRYAPDPGRGAVLAREEPDGGYVVVSTLGLGPSWRKGGVVGERQVQRARPLR
jgi:hypothetical protein